jgi:cell division protein FtsB
MENEIVEKESKVIKLETAIKERVLSSEQALRLKQAKEELDQLNLGAKDKKYAVGISTDEAKNVLVDFVANKAKWKFTESLGIIEALKTIRKENVKSGAIMMGALEIEAIYYFMSKHEGTGEAEALEFHKILKPITDSLAKLREDSQNRQILEARISGLEQGLDLAEDVDKAKSENK